MSSLIYSVLNGGLIVPGGAAPSVSTATWNPSDKDTNITLSNSNLDAAKAVTQGVWSAVRGSVGITSGKKYWEILLVVASGVGDILGLLDGSVTVSNYVGSTSHGAGLRENSNFVNGWTQAQSGTPGGTNTSGDVYMFALDADAGKLWGGRNGTWISSGNPAAATNPWVTGISGTTYPAFSSNNNGDKGRLIVTGFSYTPPTGFVAYGL